MQEVRLSPSVTWSPLALRHKIVAVAVRSGTEGEAHFQGLCDFKVRKGKTLKMLGDTVHPGTEITYRGPKGSKAVLIVEAIWDSPVNYGFKEA